MRWRSRFSARGKLQHPVALVKHPVIQLAVTQLSHYLRLTGIFRDADSLPIAGSLGRPYSDIVAAGAGERIGRESHDNQSHVPQSHGAGELGYARRAVDRS